MRRVTKENIMGLFSNVQESRNTSFKREAFFRATPAGRDHAADDSLAVKSPYLRDLLEMCNTGVWGWQLRQCMPPSSLRQSVDALIARGLIESSEPQLATA
jgi:hypothetical protein